MRHRRAAATSATSTPADNYPPDPEEKKCVCGRPRQYPDGCAWDRCCKKGLLSECWEHDSECAARHAADIARTQRKPKRRPALPSSLPRFAAPPPPRLAVPPVTQDAATQSAAPPLTQDAATQTIPPLPPALRSPGAQSSSQAYAIRTIAWLAQALRRCLAFVRHLLFACSSKDSRLVS